MQWVQGHQQVMLAPSEWWQVEGLFTNRGKMLLEPRLHSPVGGFIVTQAPPLPSHFSGYL